MAFLYLHLLVVICIFILRHGGVILAAESPTTNLIAKIQQEHHQPYNETSFSQESNLSSNLHFLDSSNKSTSCASYTNCTECTYASNFCHWCFDQKCHTKGSFYGCTIGTSCTDNSSHYHHNDTCNSHKSCTDCSLASNVCHWCAFDDQCHAIGSIYGCTYGVNCYSNDRCQRSHPEHVYDETWYHGIGPLPIFLIVGSVSMILCCSTVLYVATETLIHGLYQLITPPTTTTTTTNHPMRTSASEIQHGKYPHWNRRTKATTPSAKINTVEEAVPFLDAMEVEEEEHEESMQVESNLPLGQTIQSSSQSHHQSIELQPNNHSHLRSFRKTCKFWYTATWFLTLTSLFFILYFFPKVPDFNVCSDQLAWKSIIDGITSLKVEASFEILISIYNPNHLSLGINGVNGKLKHDGDEIGTFTVPSSLIHADSITDILVLCTVVPDKWEALGLISEYYKGTLVFDITAGGMVRIPSIGMNIPVKISDFLVPVNDVPSDRHLCSCPEWKDVKTIVPKVSSMFTDMET